MSICSLQSEAPSLPPWPVLCLSALYATMMSHNSSSFQQEGKAQCWITFILECVTILFTVVVNVIESTRYQQLAIVRATSKTPQGTEHPHSQDSIRKCAAQQAKSEVVFQPNPLRTVGAPMCNANISDVIVVEIPDTRTTHEQTKEHTNAKGCMVEQHVQEIHYQCHAKDVEAYLANILITVCVPFVAIFCVLR